MSEDLSGTAKSETGEDRGQRATATNFGRIATLTIHWFIILNFIAEIVYASYMIFFILTPEGGSGPLASRAKAMPFELMSVRRQYALEAWIAISGLAIYAAITEIGPRLRRMRRE